MPYIASVTTENDGPYIIDVDDWTCAARFYDTVTVTDTETGDAREVRVESATSRAPYDRAVRELLGDAPYTWE